MLVHIRIVGGGVNKTVDYCANCNTDIVENELLNEYGRGMLKHNNNGHGVLDITLKAGDYEFHLTGVPKSIPDMIYVDKRVLLFVEGDSFRGSNVRRNKSSFTEKHSYWSTCLICGASSTLNRPVIEAPIIHNVNNSYDYSDDFGIAAGYKDELNVTCARNFIPLCRNYNSDDSTSCCYNNFMTYKVTILWNPFCQIYYLYIPFRYRSGDDKHGCTLSIPMEFSPYRRLLALRAYKCALVCYDYAMFDMPQLTIAQDVQSRAEHTNSCTSSDCGSITSSLHFVGTKRDIEVSEQVVTKKSKSSIVK